MSERPLKLVACSVLAVAMKVYINAKQNDEYPRLLFNYFYEQQTPFNLITTPNKSRLLDLLIIRTCTLVSGGSLLHMSTSESGK